MTEPELHEPELISKLSEAFDQECQDRHDMGAEKYGAVKFLKVNSFKMAMEELADLSNYARYAWIKMALLAARFDDRDVVAEPLTEPTMPEGFINPFRKQD